MSRLGRACAAALWLSAANAVAASSVGASVGAGADDARIGAALVAALPSSNASDVILIDEPARPRAPRVHAATVVNAPAERVKALVSDPTGYQGIIPGLVRHDVERPPGGGPVILSWELEIPFFNLKGRLRVHPRDDGVELELYEGDLSPGRIVLAVSPHAGGSALTVDAQLDMQNSTFLIRHVIARSPVGEPAALAAAAYVALRATALRAEHPEGRPVRPWGPMSPPPEWLPDARPLATPSWSTLRAHGAVALVGRLPGTQRLAGVAVAMESAEPAAKLAAYLRDPRSWLALPVCSEVRVNPGPNGPGAESEDSVPFADFAATWAAEKEPTARWTATDGAIRGARLGWEVFPPERGGRTIATLLLYPRIEATGMIGRKAVASEPLLEHGTALALAFADVAGMKTALEKRAGR